MKYLLALLTTTSIYAAEKVDIEIGDLNLPDTLVIRNLDQDVFVNAARFDMKNKSKTNVKVLGKFSILPLDANKKPAGLTEEVTVGYVPLAGKSSGKWNQVSLLPVRNGTGFYKLTFCIEPFSTAGEALSDKKDSNNCKSKTVKGQ